MFSLVQSNAFPASRIHASNMRELCSWCKRYIQFIKHTCVNPCAVFDIDHTLVNETENPIKEIISLFQFCNNVKVPCFIVTARLKSATNFEHTTKMLERNNVNKYVKMFMMNREKEVTFDSVARFKRKCRNTIEREYKIVFNIGDQWSDLGSTSQLQSLSREVLHDPRFCGVLMIPDTCCMSVKLSNPLET